MCLIRLVFLIVFLTFFVFMCVFHARSVGDKLDLSEAFITEKLAKASNREEFDKLIKQKGIQWEFNHFMQFNFPETATLEDYRTEWAHYQSKKPILVHTYQTLEWVVDSPPELHLFEEYPALKGMFYLICFGTFL